MEDTAAALLDRFLVGSSINDRWAAARELMAARQLMSVVETDEFQSAFQSIGDEARYGSDIERLVAVDLVIRLSKFVKGQLTRVAKDILLIYCVPSDTCPSTAPSMNHGNRVVRRRPVRRLSVPPGFCPVPRPTGRRG